jgi:hypothetical protein
MSQLKVLVGSADRFHYATKNRISADGEFEKYLKEKLWLGHNLAWKSVQAALNMLAKPLSSDASDMFNSFFGGDAQTPGMAVKPDAADMFRQQDRTHAGSPVSYIDLIKAMFGNLLLNLFDEYTYYCEDCGTGIFRSSYCTVKGGRLAKTDDTPPYDIYMCTENQKGYTVAGAADLILHENVHRVGFKFDNYLDHCERNNVGCGLFRDLYGTGELRSESEPRLSTWSVVDTWRNCDSYACMSVWAYNHGYLWTKP